MIKDSDLVGITLTQDVLNTIVGIAVESTVERVLTIVNSVELRTWEESARILIFEAIAQNLLEDDDEKEEVSVSSSEEG